MSKHARGFRIVIQRHNARIQELWLFQHLASELLHQLRLTFFSRVARLLCCFNILNEIKHYVLSTFYFAQDYAFLPSVPYLLTTLVIYLRLKLSGAMFHYLSLLFLFHFQLKLSLVFSKILHIEEMIYFTNLKVPLTSEIDSY